MAHETPAHSSSSFAGRWLWLSGYEAGLALRRPAVHAFAGLLAVLAALSASLGMRDLLARDQHYTSLIEAQTKAQLGTSSLMGWEIDSRLRAIRPPEIGASVVEGVERSLPAYWDFGPSGVDWGSELRAGGERQHGVKLDFGILVLTLGGLLAGLYGVGMIARPKRTGTFKALLSLPIPPAMVILSKLAAASVVVTYAVLLMQIGTVAALVTSAPPSPGYPVPELVTLIGPMALPALLFLWFMVALGASVALLASEATAQLVQVALWVAISLLGPHLTWTASRLLVPATARGVMEHARTEAFANGVRAAEDRMGLLLVARAGARLDMGTERELVEGHRDVLEGIWQEGSRRARAEAEAIDASWRARRHQQAAFANGLGYLSAGALLIRTLEALAGTGAPLAGSWQRSAEHYQDTLDQELFDDRPRPTIRVPINAGGMLMAFNRRGAPKLHELPQFKAPRFGARDRIAAAISPIVGLTIYLLLAVCLAVWLFPQRAIRTEKPRRTAHSNG